MTHKKLKITLIISIILNIAFLTGMVLGHVMHSSRYSRTRSLLPNFGIYNQRRAARFIKTLSLTPDQEKKFLEHIDTYNKKCKILSEKAHPINNEILKLSLSDNPNEKEVLTLSKELPIAKYYQLVLEERLKISKILTPQQRKTLLQHQIKVDALRLKRKSKTNQ